MTREGITPPGPLPGGAHDTGIPYGGSSRSKTHRAGRFTVSVDGLQKNRARFTGTIYIKYNGVNITHNVNSNAVLLVLMVARVVRATGGSVLWSRSIFRR